MIRQQIIRNLRQIQHPTTLNQVFEFVQLIGKSEEKSNLQDVLSFTGSISDDNATEMRKTFEKEFSTRRPV